MNATKAEIKEKLEKYIADKLAMDDQMNSETLMIIKAIIALCEL